MILRVIHEVMIIIIWQTECRAENQKQIYGDKRHQIKAFSTNCQFGREPYEIYSQNRN